MPFKVATRVIPADAEAAAAAARCLAQGGLVAFPTETVYGLGADATQGEAVARLYAAKGRPAFNPLIAHVADERAARRIAVFNEDATRLAAAFWPGPLTLVLRRRPDCPVSELATAGLESVAVRVPAHDFARKLLEAAGRPIVAPSANRSGHVSPTMAEHVRADLDGLVDLIVDGGPTPVGVESTIIACLEAPTMLRAGGLPRKEIEGILGIPLAALETAPASAEGGAPLAPGMLASHYAPRARLRLNATDLRQGEALLGFGMQLAAGAGGAHRICNLSKRGSLIEAAANLFSHLRTLDSSGAEVIAVMPIPNEGLGEAINDRLLRAAAPR